MGGPQFDRLDGGMHIAIAGDDHDFGFGLFRLRLAHNPKPIDARHPQIGQNHVEFIRFDLFAPAVPLWATEQT